MPLKKQRDSQEVSLKTKKALLKHTKKCSRCKEEKPKSEYGVHSNKFDGLNTYCKPCSRAVQKTPRRKEIDKKCVVKRKAKDIVRFRCTTFKNNTKKRHESIPPMIDELVSLVNEQLPKGCYYTGDKITGATFGIDHKIPLSRGGTNDLSNLCVVTQPINKAKGNMTDIEFKQLIKLISTWEDKGVSMLTRLRLAGTIFKRG